MQFKIVGVFVLFCTFQVISSSITPEDRIKLVIAEEELILTIKSSAMEVNLIEAAVNNKIHEVKHEIQHDLKELKKEVKEAEKEAEISGKDIQVCVDAEKTSSKSLDDKIEIELSNCKNIEELQQIEIKLNELRSLKDVLSSAESKCIVEVDGTKCIDSLIEEVTQKRDNLVNDIQNILSEVDVSEQLSCIAEVDQKLNDEVQVIVETWRNCINQQ